MTESHPVAARNPWHVTTREHPLTARNRWLEENGRCVLCERLKTDGYCPSCIAAMAHAGRLWEAMEAARRAKLWDAMTAGSGGS